MCGQEALIACLKAAYGAFKDGTLRWPWFVVVVSRAGVILELSEGVTNVTDLRYGFEPRHPRMSTVPPDLCAVATGAPTLGAWMGEPVWRDGDPQESR